MKKNLRQYGSAPYSVAVVHGGPGGPGVMASVARELAKEKGILEPLQTSSTVQGQIDELRKQLDENAKLPVTLIGHSWGAMLAFLLAAEFPSYVKKLILVNSGVFEEAYSKKILRTRLSRMSDEEKQEYQNLVWELNHPHTIDKTTLFKKLGKLIARIDSYDSIPSKDEIIEYQHNIFQSVWKEVVELRKSGKFSELGQNIKCPAVVIHGDYDPHPFDGIKQPLQDILSDIRFFLLENCGHYPWLEKNAKNEFYEILKQEVY